ncbi:uncharacterized protein LOC125654529 [Ostrea edulis]|uniref:uncharacterized protein LOC125654529 n=1 Tax=Ostrea edulis TaxID=37623 RepID=UPI0024AF4722|nr:uncharacterized protein LOC125654529 [Ostrea edulis]
MILVILEMHHCVELPDNACKASLGTATSALICPSNEKEYIAAARRKNCSAYKHTCRSFEYHCVLNEWTTSLVEVCAPSTLIVSGKCTEFNKGLQCIRESYLTDCKQFSKPCPPVYNSTQTFMYPGCYDTVSTTVKQSSELSTIGGIKYLEQKRTTRKEVITNQEQMRKENNVKGDVLIIVLPIAGVLIAVVVMIIMIYLKWKAIICNRSKQKMKRNEDTALRVSDNATQDALLQDENQRTQSKEYI